MFFKCPVCHRPLLSRLILCADCEKSLSICPPLCDFCGEILTPSGSHATCSLYASSIEGFSAKYLLIGHGYQVLKTWKRTRGSFFDQKILEMNERQRIILKRFQSEIVIPVPQSPRRSFLQQGAPAYAIAQKIAKILDLPMQDILKVHFKEKSQSKLNQLERQENPIVFSRKKEISIQGKNLLLVDDFRTTGRTVQCAAQELKLSGANRVSVFTLGIRPRKSNVGTFESHARTNSEDPKEGSNPETPITSGKGPGNFLQRASM